MNFQLCRNVLFDFVYYRFFEVFFKRHLLKIVISNGRILKDKTLAVFWEITLFKHVLYLIAV